MKIKDWIFYLDDFGKLKVRGRWFLLAAAAIYGVGQYVVYGVILHK